MEAFEQFVAVALESEGFVVSPAVKFRVRREAAKKAYSEVQTHGYEVDLVGARRNRLVLATVKSFFGSRGVVASQVMGTDPTPRLRKLYALINEPQVRDGVIAEACRLYGYRPNQIELRLYAGRFAAPKAGTHEAAIREWCAQQHCGCGPIRVFGVGEVVEQVRQAAAARQYRDNPAIVGMKVLEAAGLLPRVLPSER